MNYVNLFRQVFRDTIGFMVPGAIGVLWIQHECMLLFQINPSSLYPKAPEWGKGLVLLAVGYACGRFVASSVSLVSNTPPLRKFLTFEWLGFEFIDSKLLDTCLNAIGTRFQLEDGQKEKKMLFLRELGPKIVFREEPDLYWWYIDRPNVLRQLVKTFLGVVALHFVVVLALILIPETITGASQKQLAPAWVLLAVLAAVIALFIPLLNAAMKYQRRTEVEAILFVLLDNKKPTESST